MKDLKERAKGLGFNGIVGHWSQYKDQQWLPQVIELEEKERDRRSLERRIREAKIGHFKPISDFDWQWPKQVDREQVDELFSLKFLEERANVVLVGNNGLGKTMIAQNLAHAALMRGVSTRFIKASDMLNELVECDGSLARRRTLNKYSRVGLLVLDEIGYMNYDNRFADLLYEVVSARYQKYSTIVTTNKVFDEWKDIFPNAACVVTLVDRLVHHAETILIDGESYRHKEALERKAAKDDERKRGRRRKEVDNGQDPRRN
jgi:DNA replication protein DnaC